MDVADSPPFPKPPPRPAGGHKGTFGTVLILGGSDQMIGAPMLAARSAYRAGCGLVRVAMPRAVLATALSTLPEAVGLALDGDDGDVERLRDAARSADALVVGPGLGQEPNGDKLLDVLIAAGLPAVLDADALNLLAARDAMPALDSPAVLTPHPGEMRRLLRHVPGHGDVPTDDAGRLKLAADAAAAFGCVLVLKGRRTVVADAGGRSRVNDTGDVTLAKAGSGDVLSGLVGSLLAQGMPPFDAAALGVRAHGLAGASAGRDLGTRAALASDVADRVGRALDGS